MGLDATQGEPMSNQSTPTSKPWQLVETGRMASWSDHVLQRPQGPEVKGKEFVGQKLALTGMEVSINAMPPGQSVPFVHAHKQNEELYLFLTGKGQMLLDSEVIEVGPGTAVRINPSVLRCWRNTGDVPLTCIVVQAKAGSLEQATAKDGVLGKEPPRWP
jgi:mannose-6-phosphate isomerase-like protein (cupin superfamily)